MPHEAALLFECVWYCAALQLANRLVEGPRATIAAQDGTPRQDDDQVHIFISSSSLQAHMITPLRGFSKMGIKKV
ncbi:MAG: hypothetical protein KatS3mg100_530 [Candidatus Parcubacteria bacterium]|nr:MAG: hypothetical protein KatS3mg100_530 [Candidatus Parcubacteria bacterium]